MSNPVPDLLALTSIADGSPRNAAPVRNNFSAIQTAINAFVTALSGGTLGQVIQAAGATDVQWTYPPGHEYDYAQITADVAVSGTSGAETTVITGNAVTYDGSTEVDLEVSLAGVANASGDNVTLELWDGATSIGIVGQVSTGGSASIIQVPVRHGKRFTPSAGAHTYTLKAYRVTTNGTVKAGSGAAGAYWPSFMRITKV